MIKAVDPIHLVEDVARALDWYTEVLGFTREFHFEHPEQPDYGIVVRDGHHIHFVQAPPLREGEVRGWLSLDVEDVDAVFATLQEAGALPPDFPRNWPDFREHAPEDKPYGRRDAFYVDPFGYLLHIGQDLG